MARTALAEFRRRLGQLRRDEEGAISVLSVFAVLFLVMLSGMLMNVGWQVDGKVRMQNAADAVAWSGGAVVARGMNTLAFTNHMLADIFSVTAIMREGRDGNAASKVPRILAAWNNVAPLFQRSGFPKFATLGGAIPKKTPLEQNMVDCYSLWIAAASERILPLFEEILAQEMIPQYQRAVAAAFPDIAQATAMETARLNGDPDFGRGRMLGVLWRTTGAPVGGDFESASPSLPVADPNDGSPEVADRARHQRDEWANRYLNDWNNQTMLAFDREGKMSQFGQLWRSFTCGQLKKLLEDEYPNTNLPFQIGTPLDQVADTQSFTENSFMFVGVAYWKKRPEIMPGLYRSPLTGDSLAFAQVRVFVPRERLIWIKISGGGGGGGASPVPIGGVPGETANLPGSDTGGGGTAVPAGPGRWAVGREHLPTQWDLTNQHWTCALVPAVGPNLAMILQTTPPLPEFAGAGIVLPNLGGLTDADIQRINTH